MFNGQVQHHGQALKFKKMGAALEIFFISKES
jgi:hypothetical protein